MTELYPKINEGEIKDAGDSFRLQKINEINLFFEKEIEDHRKIVKKYKKIYSAIHALNIGSGISSLALGLGGLGLFVTAILPPVAIALEGVAGGIGFSMVVFDIINRKLMHKIEMHESIYTCAVSKLNTIQDIYSKSLADGHISPEEFKLFLNEKAKYIELKSAIRKNSMSTEQKINVEELKKEFLEKGIQLGKNQIIEKLKT